jgi:hypothetical protein
MSRGFFLAAIALKVTAPTDRPFQFHRCHRTPSGLELDYIAAELWLEMSGCRSRQFDEPWQGLEIPLSGCCWRATTPQTEKIGKNSQLTKAPVDSPKSQPRHFRALQLHYCQSAIALAMFPSRHDGN